MLDSITKVRQYKMWVELLGRVQEKGGRKLVPTNSANNTSTLRIVVTVDKQSILMLIVKFIDQIVEIKLLNDLYDVISISIIKINNKDAVIFWKLCNTNVWHVYCLPLLSGYYFINAIFL